MGCTLLDWDLKMAALVPFPCRHRNRMVMVTTRTIGSGDDNSAYSGERSEMETKAIGWQRKKDRKDKNINASSAAFGDRISPDVETK